LALHAVITFETSASVSDKLIKEMLDSFSPAGMSVPMNKEHA